MGTNARLARTWFESVWNGRRADQIDELMRADAQMHGVGPEPLTRDDFKAIHAHLCAEVPDIHFELTQVVDDDEWVSVHATVTGTYEATGARVEFQGGGFARFVSGKIVETHEAWDLLSYLVQTGRADAKAAASALGLGGP